MCRHFCHTVAFDGFFFVFLFFFGHVMTGQADEVFVLLLRNAPISSPISAAQAGPVAAVHTEQWQRAKGRACCLVGDVP